MKKIALCISGYPRLYKVSYENFKKNIIEENKEYEFDFFLYITIAKAKINNDIIETHFPTSKDIGL